MSVTKRDPRNFVVIDVKVRGKSALPFSFRLSVPQPKMYRDPISPGIYRRTISTPPPITRFSLAASE